MQLKIHLKQESETASRQRHLSPLYAKKRVICITTLIFDNPRQSFVKVKDHLKNNGCGKYSNYDNFLNFNVLTFLTSTNIN